MRSLGRSLIVAFLLGLLGLPAQAQEPPIFDAHIHYSQPDWAAYTPEAILSLFDRTGVRWAMVSSTPDEGTIRLYEKAPTRIVPVLRPYRTRADMGTWTTDASILPYMQERLKRGVYKGLGEFHLSIAQANDPVVKELAALAQRQGLFLYAHTDASGIEELLRRYPQVRWLWAHAGLGEPFDVVARVVDRNPTLMIELSLKYEVAGGGSLEPRWKDLFLRHPDRFMLGTDTWVTSQWDRFAAIQADVRGWLRQLPRDVAEKLAHRNAQKFVGLP
ncbi:MAG TPA: amidohydrolase family protein [Candidatus Methylomirabilis sp.]|nr:amidohydrolase family protein [Candidatus Methylomirabilis sp.]